MSRLLTICLLVSYLHVTWSTDDLVKKAVFPPIVPEIEGQPRGHLQPFGWQRPPEGPIKEYTEALNANEFWHDHVKVGIPLVYRGYLKDSPAIEKWDDAYLARKYGDLDVLVEHKSEDRTSTSGRMALSDFLKHYKDQDMYIVSMFPTEMMHEVRAIPSILCGTFRNFTHESNFWMSSGGTRSVVHYDADHNLHCVLSGRKDFMMVNNNITTKTNLYYKKKDPSSGSGFSFLDPDVIDMYKFKRIADVPWIYATLYPGDCIFIPSKYIHQVRGYGRTIAVTTLFTADLFSKFNGDGCTDDIMKGYHSMEEIPFQWTYKKGDATIDMGYMNVELVKEQYRDILTDPLYAKTGQITKKEFLIVAGVVSPLGRNKTRVGMVWSEVFGFSDDYLFDVNTIDSLSLDQWKELCRAIESPHGVVTNGTEAVFVKPGERHKWEDEHPEDDDLEYLTEREKQLKQTADHNPMLDHLTKSEKKRYRQEMKARKSQYGVHVESVNEDDDEEEENSNWASEMTWSLDEVPQQYHEIINAGKIPLDFKEEFMGSLSDVIKNRFKVDLENNIIPEDLVRELNFQRNMYVDEIENMKRRPSPYLFWDVDIPKQKQLIDGFVPLEDSALLIKYFPEHQVELEKGILPRTLLRYIIGSDDEKDFEDDIKEIRKRLLTNRDEL